MELGKVLVLVSTALSERKEDADGISLPISSSIAFSKD